MTDPSANATSGSESGGFASVLAETTERTSSASGDESTKSGPHADGQDAGRPALQTEGEAVSSAAGGETAVEDISATSGGAAVPGHDEARAGAETQAGEGSNAAASLGEVVDVVDLEAAVSADDVVDSVGVDLVGDTPAKDAAELPGSSGDSLPDELVDGVPGTGVAGTEGGVLVGSTEEFPADGDAQAVPPPAALTASAGNADTGSSGGKTATAVLPRTPQNTAAAPNAASPKGVAHTNDGVPSATTVSASAHEQAASDVRPGVAKPETSGADGRLVDERAKTAASPTPQSTVAQVVTARDGAGGAASGDGRPGASPGGHSRHSEPTGQFRVEQATVAGAAESDGVFSTVDDPEAAVLRAGANAATRVQAGRAATTVGVTTANPSASTLVAGASAANGGGAGADVPSRTFDEGALMGSGSQSTFPQAETGASPASPTSTVAADVARTAGTMARVEQAMEAGLDRGLVGRLRDDGQMRLAVRSEGLGELDVRVAVRESGVHATIAAQHDEARQLLNSQRADLEAALERYNLRLDSFSVDVGGQENRSGMRQEDAQGSFAHQGGPSSDDQQNEVPRSAGAGPHRVGGLSVRA